MIDQNAPENASHATDVLRHYRGSRSGDGFARVNASMIYR